MAGELTGGGDGVVTGDGGVLVTGDGGMLVTGSGGEVVTGDGGALVTGDGGVLVTGDGGVLVTGSGGGVLCSAGGGAFVADSPGSGAVVADGEPEAGGVGNGDGWGASAGAPGVTGPGSAGVVPTGAGVPPASSPVPAAWDWLAVACARVVPGGGGEMTRSGRPGPPTSPPVATGTVMVTAAPGRACTVTVGAVCHSHSATPVVATATVAVGANSHGDSSHPNRSRRGRLTGPAPAGPPDGGGPGPGGAGPTWWRTIRQDHPTGQQAATRRTRDRAGSRALRAGAARVAAGHPLCAPGRIAVVVAVGAPRVQDGDGTHRQMTPSCAGTTHGRMPPDARESPGKDCPQHLQG